MLHGPKPTQRRARTLRKAMSLPEILLWQALRTRPAGLRFRRQHPAGPYVLDFFCATHRLAVGIDGEAHDCGTRPVRDARRDVWLAGQGVRVIRIAARAVLADLDAVVRLIASTPPGARYPSTSFAGPPPPPGEE
ncbi:endonuclease domain-containing protein [Sphingomonas sp. 1P06PA]|uniref:endonuclease domain-containing protein n=1 Tax=Sphingomonas sp. 1P06PA TaxID=554121 RepID=UPI0039A6BBCD